MNKKTEIMPRRVPLAERSRKQKQSGWVRNNRRRVVVDSCSESSDLELLVAPASTAGDGAHIYDAVSSCENDSVESEGVESEGVESEGVESEGVDCDLDIVESDGVVNEDVENDGVVSDGVDDLISELEDDSI